MPFMVLAAAAIIGPYEARLNATFFKSAKKKLRAQQGLITIGITGSYGKTNVKFILRDILSKRYKVLATPASFNTAMGISRVVNDQLKPEHQVFIAEMGATHVGDIKELVGLVRPKYGIITSIDEQSADIALGTNDVDLLKLAAKIAKNAPIAVRACKQAINEGLQVSIDEGVKIEEKLFGSTFETHDQVEGMACFLSREKPKPKPVFTNN